MSPTITYSILPPTLRSSWNPVVCFELHEPDWDDPATYDVKADETGFCWMQGHRVLKQEISTEQEREAWEKAREEGSRWLREYDELPF